MWRRKVDDRVDFNYMIQNKKAFRNPSIYEKLIEHLNIDELGRSFEFRYDLVCQHVMRSTVYLIIASPEFHFVFNHICLSLYDIRIILLTFNLDFQHENLKYTVLNANCQEVISYQTNLYLSKLKITLITLITYKRSWSRQPLATQQNRRYQAGPSRFWKLDPA